MSALSPQTTAGALGSGRVTPSTRAAPLHPSRTMVVFAGIVACLELACAGQPGLSAHISLSLSQLSLFGLTDIAIPII